MQDRIQRGKDMSRLKELETAFQRLPESVQKQLFPSKSQSHTQDRGRKDKEWATAAVAAAAHFHK